MVKTAEEYLRKSSKEVHIVVFDKDKPCLVATTQKTTKPDIFLVGHLDVVPASYPGAFQPTFKGDRLYARGASDMKGVDAAMLVAFLEAFRNNPDINIGLMLTTDEEVGGFEGVNFLLNDKGYRCNAAFVPDGGDNWHVCTDEKAISHVVIKAKGKAAHGSRPWEGVNANEELMEVFKAIQKEFFDKWGKATKDDNWKPTLNLGQFAGGKATNSVSDYAEMHLDIRFPASTKRNEIAEIIQKGVGENSNIEWEENISGESMHTNKSNRFLKSWVSILKESPEIGFKENNGFSKGHGASDGRFFSALDIPVIMFKPICSAPHIDDEWIDIQSLEVFKKLLVEWISKSV